MATTQDRQSSLQRIVPDRTLTKAPSSHGAVSLNVTYPDELAVADAEDLGDLAVCITPSPGDCRDRFDPSFVDPLFPTQAVRYDKLKRAFDVVFASAFMVVFSCLYLLLAVLVKLTSRGPVLFKQIRVGRGGRYFYCYKFRSMCEDAEAQKDQLMHLNEASGPVFKIKEDPRITRIGHFMRKYSLDELPQFVNVLKGDMSVVGPRPPLPDEVEMYSPHDRQRLAVRPGLTCLWQINGRSNLSFERWVELDLIYINTMSFWNDLKIVLKTIPAVFTGSGAH